jgi:hypothetical protein
MEPYQYFALHPRHLDNPDGTSIAAGHSSIRIIRLLPGHNDAPLHCVIEHIVLHDHENEQNIRRQDNGGVPFDALSYTWGDAAICPELLICEDTVGVINKSWPCNCDIPRGKGFLRVTTNLAQALSALRDQNDPRNLWVDAVCIDQTYDPEKLQQIQIMGRLYNQASMVRAWLGLEGDAKLAFDYMHHCVKNFSLNKELVLELVRESLDPVQVALRRFFSRPYFERRWIIQEVALASNVVFLCGDLELPWDILNKAMGPISLYETLRDQQGIPLAFDGMDHVFQTISYLGNSHSDTVLQLRNPVEGMMVFRLFKCYDDRDRIFALLGYFSHLWASPVNIQPQLTNASPTANSLQFAYTFVARWQLKFQLDYLPEAETRSTPAILDLFSISCVTRPLSSKLVNPHLPSWVPDWRSTEFEYSQYEWSLRLNTHYGESVRLYSNGERIIKWPVIEDPDIQGHLNVPIQLIDYVDTIILLDSSYSAEVLPNNSVFSSISSLRTICSILRKEAYHSDQVCRPCCMFRIPVQKRTMSIDLVDVISAHLYRLHSVFQGSNITDDQPKQILNYLQNPWSEASTLEQRQKLIARFLRGRCIFVSRKGYAGLANLRVRPGDGLVSVSGGEPDFVLRFDKQRCPETGFQVAELISDTSSPKVVDADFPRTMVCLA